MAKRLGAIALHEWSWGLGRLGRNHFEGKKSIKSKITIRLTLRWKKKHFKMHVSPIKEGDFPVMCLFAGGYEWWLLAWDCWTLQYFSCFDRLTSYDRDLRPILLVPELIGTRRYPKNEWQLSWEFAKQKTRKFPEGAAQCDYLQCSNQRMWLGGGNLESFNGHKLEKDGFLWRVFSS